MDTVTKISEQWVPIDHMDYRGLSVDFYEDVMGHQIFAIINGKLVEFGVYNTMYKDDAQLLIDDKLDTITRFENDPDLYGARLVRFQNGGHPDVKLIYRGRIIKVYLHYDNENENDLVSDAYAYMRSHISFLIN